jgi:putative transposase
MVCSRYIELNPVRAGMVADTGEYKWSSYCAQALGRHVSMWTPHAEYEHLGSTKQARQIAYRSLFEEELETELISEIKHAQQTGFILGTEKFRLQFEDLTGFGQSHKKRGRKPHQ